MIGGVASVHLATSCNHLTTRLVSYSFDVFTFFRDARSKKYGRRKFRSQTSDNMDR